MQYIYLKLYNTTQRNISIATSEMTRELIIQSFEVKRSTVYITGQPRNDILFDSTIINRVKQKLEHRSDEKFILYMPTWRQFQQHEPFLDSVIERLNKDNAFVEELAKKNITIYIKPHPRITIKSESNKNIFIINDVLGLDTQEIMASADMLITDYSSAFIDYALLNRPIHFYVPDLENYKENGNDLFLNFDEFAEFIIMDLSVLKDAILNKHLYSDYGKTNCEKINNLFNSSELEKGQYCKTLLDKLTTEKVLEI